MPTGDIYQLNVDVQGADGQQTTNVHHFRQASADPPSNPGEALIDAYILDAQPEHLAFLSQSATLTGYRARRVWPVPSQQVSKTAGFNGTNPSDTTHSSNVSALSTWYGTQGQPVRIKTGATHLAGIPLTGIVNGLVVDFFKTIMLAWVAKLVDIITDTGTTTDWKKVIWDTAAETATEITTGVIRSQSRKVRSRTRGVGT